MKLLLTSSGIKNTSIHHALEALLGKPIAESSALYIPTAVTAIHEKKLAAFNTAATRTSTLTP
jgi:hypothetical protein